MADKSIIIQAAELLKMKPFETILNYFKNKKEEKKALIELLTEACFETQFELNNINAKKNITEERQRAISKLWTKVCAELMIAYPPISEQFHAKAVSWASVNTWAENDLQTATANLVTIHEFIKKLASAS